MKPQRWSKGYNWALDGATGQHHALAALSPSWDLVPIGEGWGHWMGFSEEKTACPHQGLKPWLSLKYIHSGCSSLKLKQKFNCQIIYKQKLFKIIKITTEMLLIKLRALSPVWTKLRHCHSFFQNYGIHLQDTITSKSQTQQSVHTTHY